MENVTNELIKLDIHWKRIKKNLTSEESINHIKNEFETNKKLINNVDYNKIGNVFGIYIFHIVPTKIYNLKTLTNNWNEKGYIKYPKIVQKRFSKHKNISINEEYTFYIGKSEKLGSRIKEHITHEKTVSTYGLKLKGRKFFNEKNITFSYWELPKELDDCSKEIKQFIITQIESELRDKLNPWIGKQ